MDDKRRRNYQTGTMMKEEYDARILTRDEYSLWDDLIMDSPQGTIFHSSGWIKRCAELISKKEILYGFFRKDQLVAGCSIFSDKKYGLVSTAVSTAPMTPYGGFVFSPFESSKVRENELFMNTAISMINGNLKKTFDYIDIINSPGIADIRAFILDGWEPSVHYSYYFDLTGNIEEKISKNVRRTIRKACESHVSVQREQDPLLYFDLITKTYGKQGLPPPASKTFFLTMVEFILSENLGEMWVSRLPSGEPAAAEIIVWDNKQTHRWSAASDMEFNKTGATSLVLFEIFRDLQKRGYSSINLMAGNRPNLAKFISSFNPRLVPYYGLKKARWHFPFIK